MKRCNEHGSAFILSIFLLTILTLLAIGVVTTATTDLKLSGNYARTMRAFYAAEAGANHAVAMLQSDPAAGNLAPYPTGTPLVTGRINGGSYSIWLWNRRVNGTGAVADLETTDMRQFRAVGTDDQGGTRRIEGIIDAVRPMPRALDRAVFSCQAASLATGSVAGDVYTWGNLLFGCDAVNQVDVEVGGELTVTRPISGNALVNGAIHNNAADVEGACKTASTTIDRTANCDGGYTTSATPNPVKDYCHVASADWDPRMLSFTTTRIADILAGTAVGNQHAAGWTSSAAITLGSTSYYVAGGDLNWSNNTITYTGDSVVVVDGGFNFICDTCEIEPAAGAPSQSTLAIVTSAGNVTFTSAGNSSLSFAGAIWAGVTDDAGNLPGAGTVTVSGRTDLTVTGQIVCLGGPVQVVGGQASLHVGWVTRRPKVFGVRQGFAVSEWIEKR